MDKYKFNNMEINFRKLLKLPLNESITLEDVTDAILNQYQVIITYSDDKNRAPKKRMVEPYVLGVSKKGNNVFRGFQYFGDSFRGTPKWKLFRLDRITSWQPTNNHFNTEPAKNNWNAEAYNPNGDKSMATIFTQVNFNDNNDSYSPNDRLNNLRKKTERLKNSTPVNIQQFNSNINGPIKTNNSSNSEFQKMLNRNLEITKKEKKKRGYDINVKGPLLNNNKDNLNNKKPLENNTDYNSEFQEMLNRNLEISKKENDKKRFNLNQNEYDRK